MYCYRIFNLSVFSDYELEECVEIQAISEDCADVVIKQANIPATVAGETDEEKKKGDINVFHYEQNRGWFRWYGCGGFVITNGRKIEYKLLPNCNPLLVNEVILCLAFFFILYQRKMLAIHGSGLFWNHQTFILSGESGSGKSSLAEAVLQNGAKFLADDTVALDIIKNEVFALPAYPQQKLCEDQITEHMKKMYNMILLPEDMGVSKYGVRMIDRFCDTVKKLDALIILKKDDDILEPEIIEIQGSEKLKCVIQNLYKYNTYKSIGLETDIFHKCLLVAKKIKVYQLKRPSKGMTVEKQLNILKEKLFNLNSL